MENTYTVEAHIVKIVTMNICAPSKADALDQAQHYLENGTYEQVGETKKLISIS